MDKLHAAARNIYLTFTRSGIRFLMHRIPSIIFWSTISTGLLIGAQYLYFSLLPASYFFEYDTPVSITDTRVGERPVIEYCRRANDAYQVHVYAQIRKVKPPVFTQTYETDATLQAGYECAQRETGGSPDVPGQYQIFYDFEVSLPFGIKKYGKAQSETFNVVLPTNLYSEYRLTVTENDQERDGMAVYKPGDDIQYEFTATLLVTTFGTLERHIVCEDGQDYLIDAQSGRTQAGEKDTVDRTLTLPDEAIGVCRLEKRYTVAIEGGTTTVRETLRSNDFRVQ